jgi:hypothetical protein
MNPHREWFCENKRCDGGDNCLGDDLTAKIIRQGKIKLNIMDGRIRTLLGILHITGLAKNLIYVRKMDDAGVKTMFEKETHWMVQGVMVLLKGVQIGSLYNLLGTIVSDWCKSSIVRVIGVEEEKTPTVSREKVMMWHQRLGHIREKGLRLLQGKGMVEGMSNFSMDFDFYEHCVYGNPNMVRFPSGAMREERIL